MIGSMAHDALYRHLAQLGLPAIAASLSQAANPVTMNNSTQFSSTSLITDLQRPGMSILFGSVTPAPSFVGTNTRFSVVNSTPLASASASVSYALSNVASIPSTVSQSGLSLLHPKAMHVAHSVPPVPVELVDMISQNSYVDFKFLLPANLAVIASLPAISQQNMSRIPPSGLKSIRSFRDWSAAWAVFCFSRMSTKPSQISGFIGLFYFDFWCCRKK